MSINNAVLIYDIQYLLEHPDHKYLSLALAIMYKNAFLIKDLVENLFNSDLSSFNVLFYILFKHYSQEPEELIKLVDYFLLNKAPINYIEIYWSAKIGNEYLVKLFFENGGKILPSSINIASEKKHFEIVIYLIDKLVDKHSVPKKTFQNIFLNAPINIIRYILDLEIKIDRFSLRFLFVNNRLDIIKELLRTHSDILMSIGPFCISDSYHYGHLDLVEFLMKHRFPIDLSNDFILKKSLELKEIGIIVNNIQYK